MTSTPVTAGSIIPKRFKILMNLGAGAVLSLLGLWAIVLACLENSRDLVGIAFSMHEVVHDESRYSLGCRHVEGAMEVVGARLVDGHRAIVECEVSDLSEAIPPQLAEAAIQALQSRDGAPWDRCSIMVAGWPVPLVNYQSRVRFAPQHTGESMVWEESAAVPLTLGRHRFSIPITPTREAIAAALLLTSLNGLLFHACLGKVERTYNAIQRRRELSIVVSGHCPACRYPCPPGANICPECGGTTAAPRE